MLETRTRSSSELPKDFEVRLLSDAVEAVEAVSPVNELGVRVVDTAVVFVRCAGCSNSRIRSRAEDSDAASVTWVCGLNSRATVVSDSMS